jgi:hypothetical protein
MSEWVESNNLQWVGENEAQWGIIDSSDLSASIYSIAPADLNAYIESFRTTDLSAQLHPIYKKELPASINPKIPYALGASIFGVGPINLGGNIHGWATANLGALATGAYGPYDIQAYINGTGGYRDLLAYVRGLIGVQIPIDLRAYLTGTFTSDLSAIVGAVLPADLPAYLNAAGQSDDLPASIVPKVIYMSKVLQVALLEHKNLKAMINSACFGSDHLNLYAYIRSIEKLDLQGIIFGWMVDIYSNAKDLMMYINTEDYAVEDKLDIDYFGEGANKYTQVKILFTATGELYKTFDTIDILFGLKNIKNLGATVTGILHSFDLGATLTPIYDWNFTDLPQYINPKTHEIVIEFDEKWRERWRKAVEIFFDYTGDDPYHYFYVSGADQVYRVDRDRHWTIWGKSYREIEDSMIERRDVKHKYIFKMSDYANVDEAVRDLIDRVSAYRRVNLPALIEGILPHHLDLGASISPDIKYKWFKNLFAEIYPKHDTLDLSALITATEYIPPDGLNLIINFRGVGYTPPDPDDADINWTSEDME